MLDQRNLDRIVQGLWQERLDRGARLKIAGVGADDLPVIGDAVLELRLRRVKLGTRLRERRLGLGDVGARHLADLEAVARLLELLFQYGNVVFAQIHHRRVAQHVHIGGGAVLEDRLLREAHGRAGGENVRLGLLDRILRAAAVENALLHVEGRAARPAGVFLERVLPLSGFRPAGKRRLAYCGPADA
jgi:hypothetical protein